jgi:hypothetical protein
LLCAVSLKQIIDAKLRLNNNKEWSIFIANQLVS